MELNLERIKEKWTYVLECLGNDFGLDAFFQTQYSSDFYEWEKYNGRVIEQSPDYFDSELYFSSGVSFIYSDIIITDFSPCPYGIVSSIV